MFYLFIYFMMIFIIVQSICILISKNTVSSILLLINIYLLTAICYFTIGAEFLALVLIIVYVGAVSILFLFIVMMLNLRISEVYNTVNTYLPLGFFVGFFFSTFIIYMVYLDFNFISIYSIESEIFLRSEKLVYGKSNIDIIAEVLFNNYYHFLWFFGFILFTAMVGTISITVTSFDTSNTCYTKRFTNNNNIKFWT